MNMTRRVAAAVQGLNPNGFLEGKGFLFSFFFFFNLKSIFTASHISRLLDVRFSFPCH